ncbi:MAG: hypothetical protein PHQ34_03985 [Methanothrix sp.]|nr:hypothetical protein [Methanothrix sp.]
MALCLLLLPAAFGLPDEAVGRVVSVVSGDSLGIEILIADGGINGVDSIKLADIATPSGITAQGKAARDYSYSLLKNKLVYIDINNNTTGKRSKWNQLICVIYLVDPEFRPVWPPVNRILVDGGFARLNDDPYDEFDSSAWWQKPPVFLPSQRRDKLNAILEKRLEPEEIFFIGPIPAPVDEALIKSKSNTTDGNATVSAAETSPESNESRIALPSNATKITPLPIAAKSTVPSNATKVTQLPNATKVTAPSNATKIVQLPTAAKATVPSTATKVTQLPNATKIAQPPIATKVTAPSNVTKITQPSNVTKITQPSNATKITLPPNATKITVPSDATKITPASNLAKETSASGAIELVTTTESAKNVSTSNPAKGIHVPDNIRETSVLGAKKAASTLSLTKGTSASLAVSNSSASVAANGTSLSSEVPVNATSHVVMENATSPEVQINSTSLVVPGVPESRATKKDPRSVSILEKDKKSGCISIGYRK